MADQAESCVEEGKVIGCGFYRQDVLPDRVTRASVHQCVISLLQAQGKGVKEGCLWRTQLLLCPPGCGCRLGIEPGNVHFPNGRPIVIARNTHVGLGPEQGYTVDRVGAVSYYVSKTPYFVIAPQSLCVLQDGLEGYEV